MKNFQLRFVILVFFALCSEYAFPLSIYVSTTGKDTNPGTAAAPFATLDAAKNYVRILRKSKQIREAVEIIIADGTYQITKPLEFTADDSGSEQYPLIIKSKSKKAPVFTGGVKLPLFERVTDQLWKVDVPDLSVYGGSIQQLFVNGQRAIRARTPNEDTYFKVKSVLEGSVDTDKKSAVQKISLTGEQLAALQTANPKDQQVILSLNHAWDRTRKYIEQVSDKDATLTISGKPMQPWNKLDNSAQFYFENAKEFCDSAGEFFVDSKGTLFYVPRKGEQPASSEAIVPVMEQLLTIKGGEQVKVQHLRFENISFQFTSHLMPFSGEEPSQAAAPTGATIMVDYANNIYFDHCEVAHTGNNGIWFKAGCQDSKVTNSYLHDLGIGGIKIGEMNIPDHQSRATGHNLIDNNIIRSGGQEIPTGIGVLIFQSGDNTVSHNEIADFGYTGISVGWVWGYANSPAKRNKILYNHIHHLGWGLLSDMGGVYTLGLSEGTVVSNNVIHDIYSYGYGGWGLYTDEGSTGILEENNLVYNCKNSGFHQHYGKDNIIRNNIFAFQIKAQLQATRLEDHRSFTFTNNIIYYNQGKFGEYNWDKVKADKSDNIYWDTRNPNLHIENDKHALIEDPMFKDPLKYDFRFKENTVINKIGFKPFDYKLAGVYGKSSWKKLAEFDPKLSQKFAEMVAKRLSEPNPH